MGRGGCACEGYEVGCDPAQFVLCVFCGFLTFGPILIVIGVVVLQSHTSKYDESIGQLNEAITQWQTDPQSGYQGWVNQTFTAEISSPLCSSNASRSCKCIFQSLPLEPLYFPDDSLYWDQDIAARIADVPQMVYQATFKNVSLTSDTTCILMIRILERTSDDLEPNLVTTMVPTVQLGVLDLSQTGPQDCPADVTAPGASVAGCQYNCDQLQGTLQINGRQALCYLKGSVPSVCTRVTRNATNSTTAADSKGFPRSSWAKEWLHPARGAGCYWAPIGAQTAFPNSSFLEGQVYLDPFSESVAEFNSLNLTSEVDWASLIDDDFITRYQDAVYALGGNSLIAPTGELTVEPTDVVVTLRSSLDLALAVTALTEGTNTLPDQQNQLRVIATGFFVAGAALSCMWIAVVYYGLKILWIQRTLDYTAEGFITGFSEEEVRRLLQLKQEREAATGNLARLTKMQTLRKTAMSALALDHIPSLPAIQLPPLFTRPAATGGAQAAAEAVELRGDAEQDDAAGRVPTAAGVTAHPSLQGDLEAVTGGGMTMGGGGLGAGPPLAHPPRHQAQQVSRTGPAPAALGGSLASGLGTSPLAVTVDVGSTSGGRPHHHASPPIDASNSWQRGGSSSRQRDDAASAAVQGSAPVQAPPAGAVALQLGGTEGPHGGAASGGGLNGNSSNHQMQRGAGSHVRAAQPKTWGLWLGRAPQPEPKQD